MSFTNDSHPQGDYKLHELIVETHCVRRWFAEQISVGRQVLLDELKPECFGRVEEFLADVRAKAAVDHPLIASVYEAVATDGQCFYAHEFLTGATLEARKLAKEPIRPSELVVLLRRVAEMYLQLEAQKQSTAAISLEHLHLDSHGVVRVDNLARYGERESDESARDIHYLGGALSPLVADGKPGASRLHTMFSWMKGEGIEQALDWQQILDLCGQVDQQLTDPLAASLTQTEKMQAPPRFPVSLIVLAGVLGVAIIGVLVYQLRKKDPDAPPPGIPLPDPVVIGDVKSHSGLPAFRIAAYEVTIGQYAEFVDMLNTLSQTERQGLFDSKEQPADKKSHLPDDWAAMLAAAKTSHVWNGHNVTLNSPVVGVDWWDAMAYADWKNAQLPSWAQWHAALGPDDAISAKIPAAVWGPVNPTTTDRSPLAVLNVSGSVAEWTNVAEAPPANPLGAKKWVIVGGSYLKTNGNALTREWVDGPSLRRPDLGFRIVYKQL